jgi:hypothetical protein
MIGMVIAMVLREIGDTTDARSGTKKSVGAKRPMIASAPTEERETALSPVAATQSAAGRTIGKDQILMTEARLRKAAMIAVLSTTKIAR